MRKAATKRKPINKAADLRRRQLSAIHVCKTQIGLDDDTYRDLLERVSAKRGRPVRSSADMTQEQREDVLAELRKSAVKTPRGPTRAGSYPGKPRNFDQLPEMITKIEAQLADMSLSWAYADRIAKRMFQVPVVAWCRKPDQLKAIIAALDVEQIKRDQAAEFDRLVGVLHLTDRDVAASTSKLPKNWKRNRRVMRRVLDHLQAREAMLQQEEQAG
jgi:phage gp16-like protein